MGQKLEGLTVIVSPLLSLMEDQVRQLQRQGIKGAVALNSTLQYSEKRYILAEMFQYDYLFLSPEMLLQQEVLSVLQRQKLHYLWWMKPIVFISGASIFALNIVN